MADNQHRDFDISNLESELQKVMFEKAESDIDIRRGELLVKKINCLANLEKAKIEFMKLQLEQQRLMHDERRLVLEEVQAKYNIASDLSKKPEKLVRAIGKIPVGLFGKQDKQVVEILQWAQKLQSVDNE
jgi:hypothetical protein